MGGVSGERRRQEATAPKALQMEVALGGLYRQHRPARLPLFPMKIASFFFAVFVLGAGSLLAEPGSAQQVPVSTDEIVSALGIKVSASEFTFDVPVFCRVSLSSAYPEHPTPVKSSTKSHRASSKIRVSYCLVDPQAVANALGLTPPKPSLCRYQCTLTSGDPAFKSQFTLMAENAFVTGEAYSGQSDPPKAIPLDTDIVFYSSAGPMRDGEPPVQTIQEIVAQKRYVLVVVRFSKTPLE